jgi:hypothetical protein
LLDEKKIIIGEDSDSKTYVLLHDSDDIVDLLLELSSLVGRSRVRRIVGSRPINRKLLLVVVVVVKKERTGH